MTKAKRKTGLGITGFVLSLVAFFGWIVPYFSVFLAILAIVFSGLQIKKDKTGLAVAGLVIGIIAVLSNLFWLTVVVALFGMGAV